MKVDITNLELEEVLVTLHTAARVSNTTFLDNRVPTLSYRIARQLIEEAKEMNDLKFDRLIGRALHIDLTDDLVDLTRYNMNNGQTAGIAALFKLSQEKGVSLSIVLDNGEAKEVTEEYITAATHIHDNSVLTMYSQGHLDMSAFRSDQVHPDATATRHLGETELYRINQSNFAKPDPDLQLAPQMSGDQVVKDSSINK